MSSRIRTTLLALAVGLFVTAATVAMIVRVTNDMRWVLFLGAVGLFSAGVWLGGRREGGVLAFVLLCLPLATIYGALVVPELPGLWPHLLFWLAFSVVGWLGFRSPGRRSAAAVTTAAALSVLALWYAFAYVPAEISRRLGRLSDDPAPEFVLESLDGDAYPLDSLAGKVVVLDFFATWCLPCIAELPEIDSVRRHYATSPDVEILVVANDSGGDTPEAIRAFAAGRDLEVPFLYDPGGKAHKAFGFAGLPGLVVMDKANRIRFTREGYNAAETKFRENLVKLIEELRGEVRRP